MGCFVVTIWRSAITDKCLGTLDLNEGQKRVLQYDIVKNHYVLYGAEKFVNMVFG